MKKRPNTGGKRQAIARHYEPRLARHGRGHMVCDWACADSQHARFRVLLDNVDLRGKSLLDVGCGLGDLVPVLEASGVKVDYTGVDILEKMVQAARQHHPGARFLCADLFHDEVFPPESFDVVFCSGAFNLNLGNNAEFRRQALPRLLRLARQALVFNLLHERSPYRDDDYAYSNPEEVRLILEPLGCRVQILDDYLPNDFTVICRKE